MLKIKRKEYKVGDWIKCVLKPHKATGYIEVRIDDKMTKIHRIIAFCFGKLEQMNTVDDINDIDHINNIKTDNRVENLRQVTAQQNCFNRKNTKGYTLHKKTKKWNAYISINKKRIHLGLYDTEAEARTAYLRAKEIHHVI